MLEMVSTPEDLRAYRDWQANPVTRKIHELAKSAARPMPASPRDGTDAAYELGLFTGYSLLLRLVFEADAAVQDGEVKKRLASLIPTYGVTDAVIKKENGSV